MDPILGAFEQTIARNLVKHAAGTAIFCPRCETILDCKTTVVLSDKTKTLVLCSCCYGRGPGNIKAGSVEVWDGRALWPTKQKRIKYAKPTGGRVNHSPSA